MRGEIERLTAKFSEAVTNRNLEELGAFYEEHARFLPPGMPMVEGREAIQAAMRRMVERGITSLKLEAIDIIEVGDFAIEIGQLTLTARIFGLFSITRKGKSIVVWHRQKDGALKIAADTFNRNTGC